MGDFANASGVKATTTAEQRVGAIATCARQAVNVADLAELLDILGLTGSAEEIAAGLPAAPGAPVEPADPSEAWRTAAELADSLEQTRRLLGRLVKAVTGTWRVRGDHNEQVAKAVEDVERVRAYLVSLQLDSPARAG